MVVKQVSAGRQIAFYAGYFFMGTGLFLFLAVPVALFTKFPAFTASNLLHYFLQALLGLVLVASGGFLRKVGIRGLAGSVVILDPSKAREDLEPWSRAAGGLVDAALSEVRCARDLAGRPEAPGEAIKVRCPRCKALNDEDARFCNQCAAALV